MPQLIILGARAIGEALKNWPNILAMVIFILALEFSLTRFFSNLGDSSLKYAWLAVLASAVYLAREFIRAYFKLKRKELGLKK